MSSEASIKWIISKGTYWIIGNGENTNIWEEILLPNQGRLKVLTQKPLETRVIKVRDLIIRKLRFGIKTY